MANTAQIDVDPRAKRIASELLRKLGGQQGTAAEHRVLAENIAASNGPGPRMDRVIEVEGRGGAHPPLRVLMPIPRPRGITVLFHGGGWTGGSINAVDTVARKLAERTGCALVLASYGLAVAHRRSTPFAEAYRATEWAASYGPSLTGRDNPPLFTMGIDVGAALALNVAIRARDLAGPRIGLQVLITPALVEPRRPQRDAWSPDFPPSRRAAESGWRLHELTAEPGCYTPHTSAPSRERLLGLPPTVLLTAGADPYRADAERLADELDAAHVPINHRCYPGQPHDFFSLLQLHASERGFQQVVRATRAHLTPATSTPVASR